jgi:predicted KAP-like P-loop ATPase
VLNYIKREFATTHADKVLLFEFNPWLFTNQEELLAHFFVGLAAKLEESLRSRAADAGQFLQKYSGVFGFIPVVGGGASKLAEQLGKELSANPLSAQRERVFDIMKNATRTVVVLIDDLDRLDREEILTVLKLIRLNANFPRIVYVLAFDDEVVARAVSVKYGGGPEVGRQFLEKIVQYPYALPAVGHERLVAFVLDQARDACGTAGVEMIESDWNMFGGLMDGYFSRRLTTPRQAIRYANALDFALPMLRLEANPFEQMLVEGLRILFPELYMIVRDDIRSFTQLDPRFSVRYFDQERFDKYANTVMAGSSADDIAAGTHIVRTLFDNSERPHSIARVRFFDRYFSYAAPITKHQ